MERMAGVEHVIEVGRQEGPRLIAEQAEVARKWFETGAAALGVGVARAWSEALSRLRPTPRRRSRTMGLIVLSVALSLSATAAAIVISRLRERSRRQREENEAVDASAPAGVRAVVAMPVAADVEPGESQAARGAGSADEAEERITEALAS